VRKVEKVDASAVGRVARLAAETAGKWAAETVARWAAEKVARWAAETAEKTAAETVDQTVVSMADPLGLKAVSLAVRKVEKVEASAGWRVARWAAETAYERVGRLAGMSVDSLQLTEKPSYHPQAVHWHYCPSICSLSLTLPHMCEMNQRQEPSLHSRTTHLLPSFYSAPKNRHRFGQSCYSPNISRNQYPSTRRYVTLRQ
jgi:hypothetical protein